MLLGRVSGNVWGARQAEGLQGYRLLVVQPLTARPADARSKKGAGIRVSAGETGLCGASRLVVAADRLGAGPGELVLVAHGSRCRDLTLGETVPTKEVVVAIVDEADVTLAAGGEDHR